MAELLVRNLIDIWKRWTYAIWINKTQSSQIYIFTPCQTILYESQAMKPKLWIVLFENFQFFRTAQIQILRNLIGWIWGGAMGLEIIIDGYMPWLYGKTLCTCMTHNLRFFDFFLTNIDVCIFLNIWEFFDWTPILWGFLLIKPLRCQRATSGDTLATFRHKKEKEMLIIKPVVSEKTDHVQLWKPLGYWTNICLCISLWSAMIIIIRNWDVWGCKC